MSAKSQKPHNGLIPAGNTVGVGPLCGLCRPQGLKLFTGRFGCHQHKHFLHFPRHGIECSATVTDGPERMNCAMCRINLKPQIKLDSMETILIKPVYLLCL